MLCCDCCRVGGDWFWCFDAVCTGLVVSGGAVGFVSVAGIVVVCQG